MPLPFSFSTQRHDSEAETPLGSADIAEQEKVMNYAPGNIITEPVFGTPGNSFSPPVLEASPRANIAQPRMAPNVVLPPSTNLRFARSGETPALVDFSTAAAQHTPTAMHSSAKAATPTSPDWSAQMEQLRNDVFGIAMSVSALNDRLDRLEQRLPQGGQSVQAGIATLRGEIESWLENHLNGAVEHCLHRIMSRTNSSASVPAN